MREIRKILFCIIPLVFGLVIFFSPAYAYQYEHIESFDSVIELKENGYVHIIEKIQAYASGDIIKRGIYRDIPTNYKDGLLNYNVDLSIIKILKDEQTEPYFTKSMNNGTRIYIGDENIYLNDGYYLYTIEYEMGPMAGFFDGYDELYLNITGNGWDFSITKVTGKIIFPTAVNSDSLKIFGYTGYQGENGLNYNYHVAAINGKTTVFFNSTDNLVARQGLTMAVGFPKGIVAEQNDLQHAWRLFVSSVPLFIPIALVFILLVYYIVAWILYGKDPKSKTTIPLYSLSKELTPMMVRLINRMSFDSQVVVCGLMGLASKGYITIKEISKKEYKITSTGKVTDGLQDDELELYNAIIKKTTFKITEKEKKVLDSIAKDIPMVKELLDDDITQKSLTVGQDYSSRVHTFYKRMEAYLKTTSENYYKGNEKFLITPIIILILIALYTVVNGGDLAIGAIFWNSMMIPTMIFFYFPRIKEVSFNILIILYALLMTALYGFFVFVGIGMAVESDNPLNATIYIIALIIVCLIQPIMKIRTKIGREKQDEIEGFKMFLKTTEPNKLKILYPDLPYTVGTYEKLLPFCIAVGLEKLWSQKFADLFATLPTDKTGGYHPAWYFGSSFSGSSFASSFSSSISGSISASSSTPGSSSGSGGGGSSGGGGGGGGGGGW